MPKGEPLGEPTPQFGDNKKIENGSVEAGLELREKEDSVAVAREKLLKLLDENFKDFGRRFMNIGEYEEIMKSGSLQARECNIDQDEDNRWRTSFKGWLQRANFYGWYANRGLSQGNMRETDFGEPSGKALLSYRILLWELRRAHEEANKEKKDNPQLEKSVRDLTIEKFIEARKGSRADGPDFFEGGVLRRADEDRKEKLKSSVGDKRYKDLEFLNGLEKNPELLKEGDNLRRLFSILPYIEDIEAHMYGAGEGGRHFQYEVVLILNSNAVSDKKSEWYWKLLKPGEMKGDELLGVVVIMPDKKMVERVVALSSNAGKLSHPVFTDRGNVVYPKPEKSLDEVEKSKQPELKKKRMRVKPKN